MICIGYLNVFGEKNGPVVHRGIVVIGAWQAVEEKECLFERLSDLRKILNKTDN